ncbi:MAG: polyphosphate:AMP phosphotransferase [Elusimicrobiota bacterium]|nr:MAG: polyphosphate:AMP phosphotransferase [Elusimicrobiota bacterium]
MFESAELGREVDKEEFEKRVPALRARILRAQQALAGTGLRLVIVVGGVEGSGKTELARRFLEWMDARGLRVESFADRSDEEEERPCYWRYWRVLPPAGHGAVLVSSWYTPAIVGRVMGESSSGELDQALDRAIAFETMLVREGTVLVKLWLHLSKKAQRRRFKELEADPATAWRVTKRDWKYAKRYGRFRKVCERALAKTGTAQAPWTVVDAEDRRWRDLSAGEAVAAALEAGLERAKAKPPKGVPDRSKPPVPNVLSRLDMSKDADGDYEDKLEKRQRRVALLFRELLRQKRSLICAFEGVDAAGKGGAIRRLLAATDVRDARVMSVAAPTDEERAHPYLWRFWRQLPRVGNATIYDRSWYGRVLVERVEGFCSRDDWKRAYEEIGAFEEELTEAGVIVCKFWLQISAAEQLRRFKERVKTPFKQYKITEEDWRNRRKWDAYQAAAVEMIERTSSPDAPWILIPAERKKYARLKVLEAVADRLEEELG